MHTTGHVLSFVFRQVMFLWHVFGHVPLRHLTHVVLLGNNAYLDRRFPLSLGARLVTV